MEQKQKAKRQQPSLVHASQLRPLSSRSALSGKSGAGSGLYNTELKKIYIQMFSFGFQGMITTQACQHLFKCYQLLVSHQTMMMNLQFQYHPSIPTS